MAHIIIKNLSNKKLDLSACSASLLHCLLGEGLDWMHSCGGKGRCTSCRVAVLEGMDNLTPLSVAEMNYRQRGLLLADERLTCQIRVKADVLVKVPDDCKLPHLLYSDETTEP